MRAVRPRAPRATSMELDGIHAGYGRVEVLHGVSLSVEQSTVLALLGPNGAGKSTTLKVASGRLKPTRGEIRFGGINQPPRSSDGLARAGVCCVPEGRSIFPSLTIAENVRMWTRRGGVKRADVEEITYNRFPVLASRRRQLAGTLSGGEQQMLAMSRALSTRPSVLLLDEVSMGLAPMIVSELFEVIGNIANEGIAIVVVEQFVEAALSLASRAVIMIQGEVVFAGSPDEAGAVATDMYLRISGAGANSADAATLLKDS